MLSDAFIEVTCDGCHAVEVIQLTATAHGWDERDVEAHLEARGWTITDDKHWCEDCTDIKKHEPS